MELKINTDLKEKTIDSSRSYIILNLTGQLISWLFTFWVIRLLEPEDFGLMSMGMVFINFVRIFSTLGLGTGIIQRKHVSQNELSSVFWFMLFIGFTLTISVNLFSFIPGMIFENEDVIPVLKLISLIFIISCFSIVPQNLMARNYEFSQIAKINIWAAVISSCIGVALASLGYGVYALVYSVLSLEAVKAILFFTLCLWKPSFSFSLHDVSPFFRFGIFLSLSATLTSLTRSIDRIIVGRFFGSAQLGFYSTGMTVSDMAIDKVSPIFNQLLLPMLSRYSEIRVGFRKTYLRALSYYLLILMPVYVGLALVAEDLVLVLFGEKWRLMIPFLQVFSWVNIFRILSSFQILLFTSMGKSKRVSFFSTLNFIVLIPAMLVASMFSIEYIILSWAVCVPGVTVIWILLTLKETKIKLKVFSYYIMRGAASSLIMAIAVALTIYLASLMFDSHLYRLVLSILVGISVYLAFLYFYQKELLMNCLKFIKK